MARITRTSKWLALALLAAVVTATADQILLDDGATQLNVGTTASDGTGDTVRAGGLKMKQWAADINTMNAELYAATSGTVYSIANCPGVALDGVTDDAPEINACIAAQPEGTTFSFPSGKTIGLKSSLKGFKSFQRVAGNGATLKALIVSSTLGANLAHNSTSVTVADRTGFVCGQVIKAGTRNADVSATLTNLWQSTITGTSGAGNCTPATGAGVLYLDVGLQTCAVNTSDGNCTSNPTISTGAGVVVVSAGQLIFQAASGVNDLEVFGFSIDGSRGAVNDRIPRWESDHALQFALGHRYYVHDIIIKNTDGDGLAINGDNSRASNITGENIGGNLIHWADGYYQQATGIVGTDINLAGTLMGHQDGLITFSNNCNYAVLSDLEATNAKRVIGGLDAAGGTHFTASNLLGTNLTTGPFYIYNAGSSFTGTLTNASASVTGITSTRGLFRGYKVTGTGIPASTYIASIDSATAVTLSNAATASGAQTISWTGGPADIAISNGSFDNSEGVPGLIEINGYDYDGGRARNIRLSNIVGKNIALKMSGVENSNVSMTLDNAGRTGTANSASNSTVLVTNLQNSTLDLFVEGGTTGITVAGASTRNLQISGTVKNPQGASNSRAIYLDNTLPTTPEVHLSRLTLIADRALDTAWAGSTAYALGNIRSNGGSNYIVRVAGTSAASGGPSGANAAITDGTVTWGFVNTPGRYTATGGASGYTGINATAGFTLTDSVIDITGGSRLMLIQGGAAAYEAELRRNVFRNVSGYDSCCRPIQVSTTLSRLTIADNHFPGYDTGATQDLIYMSAAQNDMTIVGNIVHTPSTGNVIRVNGNTSRSVIKDNVFPYRSGAGTTWTTPATWAEQTTTSADPIYLNGTGTDDLIVGNVMRKAVSP